MYTFTLKTMKIGFWIVLPFLLISNAKIDPLTVNATVLEGAYDLQFSGATQKHLEGSVSFETKFIYEGDNASEPSLLLKFWNKDENAAHFIEFMIAKHEREERITTGTYNVNKKINGFLNDFDGVFGFANIKNLGEQPFFSHSGKIVITKSTDRGLIGHIRVSLTDMQGRVIWVKGNFHAIASPMDNVE